MSLINQVLKDLEQRREEPVSSVDGAILSVPRYAVARSGDSFLVYVFGAVLIILSLLVGFLVWDRQVQREPSAVASVAEAPLQAAAAVVPVRPQEPVPETARLAVSPVAVSPAVVVQKKTPLPAASPKQPQTSITTEVKSSPPVVPSEAETEDGAGRGSMQKQRRPLTQKQLAEQTFQQAYAALRKGQVAEGESFLRKLLAGSPGHIKAREMLAGLYIKAGRYVEAAQLLQQGVAIKPGHSMFRKLYARVLLEQNALDQAVTVLERRLPLISQDVDYYALLAALYQRQGRHKNAIAVYQNMLRQNAMVGIWWIGMGISLEKLGDSEAARQAYEKARSSGTLAAQMIQYTDNRLAALNEIGYPDE